MQTLSNIFISFSSATDYFSNKKVVFRFPSLFANSAIYCENIKPAPAWHYLHCYSVLWREHFKKPETQIIFLGPTNLLKFSNSLTYVQIDGKKASLWIFYSIAFQGEISNYPKTV